MKTVSEILSLFKEFMVGGGSAKEIGIHILIFLVGTLTTLVGYYVRRDVSRYGDDLSRFGKHLSELDGSVRKNSETLAQYKNKIAELIMKNTEVMRSESHQIRINMIELQKKLVETQSHLNRSHETREEVYDLLRAISDLDKQSQDMFGRVILLEETHERYQPVLSSLMRILKDRAEKRKR